jgi:hypothetical protein
MHMLLYRPIHLVFSLFVVATLLLMGCGTAHLIHPAAVTEIPDGANRIVLMRTGTDLEMTPDQPPLSFFLDARRHLEAGNHSLDVVSEEMLTMSTNPIRVDDNMYLRLEMNATAAPGGSQLTVAPHWATSPAVSPAEWEEARWVSGPSADAFGHAWNLVSGISFSDIGATQEPQ